MEILSLLVEVCTGGSVSMGDLEYLEALPLGELLQGRGALPDEIVPSIRVPVIHLDTGHSSSSIHSIRAVTVPGT